MLRRLALQFLIVLLLAAGGAAGSWWRDQRTAHRAELEPGEVRASTARMWGAQVLWVDVRDKQSFQAGHIDGAVRLNDEEWNDQVAGFLAAWDSAKPVVVYGDGGLGDKSYLIADHLRSEVQLDSVYVLKGGWPAWQER